MAHARSFLATPALTAALLAACAASPALAPSPAGRPPAPMVHASAAADFTGTAGEYRSKRMNFTIALPDIAGWRVDDAASSWLVASHDASESFLFVRTWREDEIMNRTRCEERARLSRRLPEIDELDVLERRAIDVPDGFDTVVEIAVSPEGSGKPIEAAAAAFGGWAHKCFAFVYSTRARGADAEALLGRRLATIVQMTLGRFAVESELSPAIPRDPTRRD